MSKMINVRNFDELNAKLANNPAWQKVRWFSALQELFLVVALIFATIKTAFAFYEPFWSFAFLIFGILSVVFGRISMNTFRDHFVSKSDITEEVEKGN